MNKEQKLFEMVNYQVERLKKYPEVLEVVHAWLKEVEKQVGSFEGEMLATEMGDALFEVMDDHGWIEEGEAEAKEEIQEMIKKAIK